MGKYKDMKESILRDAAWIGDAVLSLYLRQLLITNEIGPAAVRAELFKHFSSNQFLNTFGRPTAMEAEIGTVYNEEGLAAAFEFIEDKYLDLIRKQLRNRDVSSHLSGLTATSTDQLVSPSGEIENSRERCHG